MKIVTDRISLKKTMLLGSVGSGLVLCAMALSATTFAQDAAKPDDAAAETIVVTGSRISRPDLQSAAPVTVISTEDVKNSGSTKVEDLLNNLPQVFANQNSGVSNGADGTARVDLRNLGSNRTLVLIDGRRLAPGGIGGNAAADLNFIPSALISNIQILTGGASSTYGADAVSGVVNFVMNRNFDGIRVDANYGFYQHNNHNPLISTINQRFATPNGSVVDGGSFDGTVVMGAGLDDNKGHVTAYAGYRRDSAITQDSRDFSTCTLNPAAVSATLPAGLACGGSGTPAKSRFGGFSAANRTLAGLPAAGSYSLDPAVGAGRGLRPFVASDQFNFAPLNYYRRPSTRFTFGAFADYEINEHFQPYLDVMYMDYSTKAQIAPSGAFFGPRNVNCDNPLLLASTTIATAACGAAAGTAVDANFLIGKRNIEGGGRFNDIGFSQFRIVNGIKGDIVDGWNYDVSAQYGQVNYASTYRNDVSDARIDRALQVVNVAGVATCKSVVDGSDPSCVPYNVFQIGGISQAAVNYISIPLVLTGKTTELIVNGYVAGDLGKYGLQSPLADAGVQIVLGAEYRKEKLSTQPDLSYINGDGAGQGGPTLPIKGSYTVKDLFAELSLPLVQDKPFFENLSLDLGYRRSTYDNGGSKTNAGTYKIELAWSPIEDVKFRGSINRAVRAANIGELFANNSVGLFNGEDPCVGTAPTATVAQCAATGLAPALYGTLIANSAQQYNLFSGGSLALKPEKADTWTAGVVIQPKSILPGFSLTIDYFNIKVKDAIGGIGAQVILDQCVARADPFFCGKINRSRATGAVGSLWLDQSGFVNDAITNTGSLATAGVDVSADYKFDITDESSLSLRLSGTYLDKFVTQPITGGSTYDCAGYYGIRCASVNPKWRHSLRLRYDASFPMNVSLTWRYINKVKNGYVSTDPTDIFISPTVNDDKLPSVNYFDLAFGFPVNDKLNFRLGVNNILDKDPPIISQGSLPGTIGNGNTIVGTYDYLGRKVFMNITADF
jgi:iron complex outermembrane recepter protein